MIDPKDFAQNAAITRTHDDVIAELLQMKANAILLKIELEQVIDTIKALLKEEEATRIDYSTD